MKRPWQSGPWEVTRFGDIMFPADRTREGKCAGFGGRSWSVERPTVELVALAPEMAEALLTFTDPCDPDAPCSLPDANWPQLCEVHAHTLELRATVIAKLRKIGNE